MSDLADYGYESYNARVFNARAADSVGWKGKIPIGAVELVPGLRNHHATVDFAEAVHDLQKLLFTSEDEYDGKLGRGTWRAILGRFDNVGELESYLVYNGRRLRLPEDRGYRVICFDQPGGLDLHREADWQRGRAYGKPLREIVLHWAGGMFDAKRLFNYFENAVFNAEGTIVEDPRNVSSHGAIELSKDGIVRVYQWIDLYHRTWHGGHLNPRSTGWDILIDPREKYLERQRLRGWDVSMVRNDSGRGPDPCVSMDPRLATGIRHFLEDHLAACELGELLIPLGSDGLQKEGEPFNGVIPKALFKSGEVPANVYGHHHGSKSKSDVGPYMQALFGDFYR